MAANGRVFPYLESGKGPLFLCIHGFPDVPRSFRHQLRSFADAGYRVVAPYLRGYAPSNIGGPYQMAALGRDAVALIQALGHDDAVVLGHDWGSAAASATALLAPERVRRLVLASLPYGPGMARALVTNAAQQRRSWYLFFFQSRLADIAVPFGDFAFIDALWRDWSPGFAAPPEELAAIKATLAQPGVLEAALGYYRTAFDPTLRAPELESDEGRIGVDPIRMPTLYLHGEGDGCVGPEVSAGMESLFPGGFSRLILPNTGHFLHQEDPEAFDHAVLEFVGMA